MSGSRTVTWYVSGSRTARVRKGNFKNENGLTRNMMMYTLNLLYFKKIHILYIILFFHSAANTLGGALSYIFMSGTGIGMTKDSLRISRVVLFCSPAGTNT